MNLHANDSPERYAGKLTWLARWLLAMILSGWVIAAFLSHWSLLDGAPRNSLALYLDSQAHRPFAYRVLAPALVRALDDTLPSTVQAFLADEIAPKFHVRYVVPLKKKYETLLPGITARADADWSQPRYRRAYVLMVTLMWSALTGAFLLIHRAAWVIGKNALRADAVTLLYALVLPTMFLNGGYFYDFTEQLCAAALIVCVLESRWIFALATLVLMQANKETALLMTLFLAPYAWITMRWRMWPGLAGALLLCLAMLMWVRWVYSHLPGLPVEWHLAQNLQFWSRASSWTEVEDFYAVNLALPRMSYLYFSAAALMWGLYKGVTPTVIATTSALFILVGLLLTMGYQDEFRNLSLATPFLVLLMSEQRQKKSMPKCITPSLAQGNSAVAQSFPSNQAFR